VRGRYVLKLVLHGKTDDKAMTILQNCRSAMQHSKRLIIERVPPEYIVPNDRRGVADLSVTST